MTTVTGVDARGRVGISGEVATAVQAHVLDALYEHERDIDLEHEDLEKLAWEITERTLETYNSVRAGSLVDPVPQLATGITGCQLEAALRDKIEMVVNRLTYGQWLNGDSDSRGDVDAMRERALEDTVEQILARLKARGYPIDPKAVCILYAADGSILATIDLSTGYNLTQVRPSAFKDAVEECVERFQGRY
jgi:hypothetical protein